MLTNFTYPLCMQKIFVKRHQHGFTIIELLVVIAIIVLLVSILVPAMGKAIRTARSTEDKTQAKGIFTAMVLYASSNNDKLPRPSFIRDNFDPDITDDTTGNLMSVMIGRNYFTPDYCISPVETNPNIIDIDEFGIVYDYAAIDGEEVFWDPLFNGDIEGASASNPAHNSYAHQALVGHRAKTKWNSSAGSSDLMISNRGPRDGAFGEETDSESFTLQFHGSLSSWSGSIVSGDGASRIARSTFPEGIAYQPLNGMPLGPDNIFDCEWNDISISGTPEGMPSGDNWMVICTELIDENSMTAAWD